MWRCFSFTAMVHGNIYSHLMVSWESLNLWLENRWLDWYAHFGWNLFRKNPRAAIRHDCTVTIWVEMWVKVNIAFIGSEINVSYLPTSQIHVNFYSPALDGFISLIKLKHFWQLSFKKSIKSVDVSPVCRWTMWAKIKVSYVLRCFKGGPKIK